MINFKACTDVTMDKIFEAFSLGFSDYIIPLKMSQEDFQARFFGPEGNKLDLSFIAVEKERAVGLILGGIRIFDGLKTLRCGTFCIAPEYRGQGVSQKLFEMHKAAALDNHCKQLFLEVIKSNERAIRFYEKCDYRAVHTLKYYSAVVKDIPASAKAIPYTIKRTTFEGLETFRKSLPDCHINWQSDTPYYAGVQQYIFLGAYDGGRQVSLIAVSPQGKINFLWVDPSCRNQGLGHNMLLKALEELKPEKVSVTLPGNASLEGFFRKLGFRKEPIEQYEMYLPL